ncbi:Alpha-glucosidase [Smittium mucronatum]|uniref:Maltase n=1 Tax=Smittium mucronatum TaxID=133383 RepID=A0A1R0GTI7_9FUNG|nr:Alpha-glucosidase [Smittium mucronatum]
MRSGLLLLAVLSAVSAGAYDNVKYPAHDCPGYNVNNIVNSADNSGFTADLYLAGSPCNIYGIDIQNLTLTVSVEKGNKLSVLIEDRDKKQFQIPPNVVQLNQESNLDSFADLTFKHTVDPKTGFGFQILRGSDAIFDTFGYPLVFEDQYIELTSRIPHNANIYGMGETPDYFKRDNSNSTKTIWARDAGDPFRQNVYGSHTVYMENRGGKFHGAYMHNSHGMDIVMVYDTIQYRMLGGVIDMSFFGGPSAYDVINSYTDFVGRPNKIPYWVLGLHNCRWGYQNIDEVDQVIANYSKANIPLEVMWIDIDSMEGFKDFTFDPVNFPLPRIQNTYKNLHEKNQKLVMMVNPAIQRNSSYGPYTRGLEQNTFVKNLDGSTYIGEVWPGYTAYPDWFAANTTSWWHSEFQRFYNDIPLDGVWVDMNEASSFCIGSCGSNVPEDVIPEYPWEAANPLPNRPLDKSNLLLNPKYAIHNGYSEISEKGIETIAIHANGVQEYHVHNLYGHMMTQTTHSFLEAFRPNVRPFLLSRSTFAGTGRYANHWNGDNNSDWFQLHISIPSMLDFGIFGIPFVGSDICGFFSNTTEQLCNRWVELGAFYPFSRVHNAKGNIPQELYRWDSVAESARIAYNIRYQLLPYYYTNFYTASTIGSPVARPLTFEFPADTNLFNNDLQFMVGESILISPVLFENATSVDAYFPGSTIWYDWYTHSGFYGQSKNVTLDAPLNHINVHIRGGSIIPTQDPAMTVEATIASNFTLIIALDDDSTASGSLYLDDGISVVGSSSLINFSTDGESLVLDGSFGYHVDNYITKVIMMYPCGTPENPSFSVDTIDCVEISLNSKSTTELFSS